MTPSAFASSAGLRAVVLYLVWIALAGVGGAELAVGVPVVLLATMASLRLLPPVSSGARARHRASPGAALRSMALLVLRFPFQSLTAGIDVARAALSWPLRVQPGEVVCPCALPRAAREAVGTDESLARGAFRVLLALQPGSLPVAEREDGALIMHCLDVSRPVAAEFAREQARFVAALGLAVGEEPGK